MWPLSLKITLFTKKILYWCPVFLFTLPSSSFTKNILPKELATTSPLSDLALGLRSLSAWSFWLCSGPQANLRAPRRRPAVRLPPGGSRASGSQCGQKRTHLPTHRFTNGKPNHTREGVLHQIRYAKNFVVLSFTQ